MPSTFTNSLGIELPADGEKDAVWGDIVNDNMNIVDRATNGVVTVSLAGTTHTLTTSDGLTSDGQYHTVIFGGSPSGTNTVTLAPNDAQKAYHMVNNSGQSVIISQGSGANVTIPNGTNAVVYADGAGAGAAVFDFTDGISLAPSNITGLTASVAELNILDGVTSTTAELNILDGVTSTAAELNILDGVTSTTAELNILDGVTSTAAELNILDGVTSTAAELNILDGALIDVVELNRLDGLTSAAVGVTDVQTLTSKTLDEPIITGAVTQTVGTITGTTPAIDPADGAIQTWTLTANSTPTETLASGQSITLMIDDGTAFAVTWTMVDQWAGGVAPTLAPTGYSVFSIWKVGTTVYAALVGYMS